MNEVAIDSRRAETTFAEKIMLRQSVPHLSVGWGYDVRVDLQLSQRNWSKISKGKKVTIRGKGYYYEGDFFWGYWDFSGGIDGELAVRYGSPKDGDYSGQGFVGNVREALVE
jgi:hypothetical protein